MPCCASSCSGALVDLAAKGAPNAYLDQAPESTFFRQLYRRHTPFAKCHLDIGFCGAVQFGKCLHACVPRNGDLLGETYVQSKLTALEIDEEGPAALTQANDYVIWVNAVGHVLIQCVSYSIGGSQFDRHFWYFLHLWERVSGHAGRYLGEMIGYFDNVEDQRDFAARDRTLWTPLQFSFCRHHELYLPLIALQHHDVTIDLELADREDLIKVYDSATPETLVALTNVTGGELEDVMLTAAYVYCDTLERRLMAQQPHEFLITQLQTQCAEAVVAGTTSKCIPVCFSNPILEFFWFFQEDVQKATTNLNWFSWGIDDPEGAYPWAAGVVARVDAIDEVEFMVNGHMRFEGESLFFRTVIPHYHHSSIPTIFVYNYSFCLFPEDDHRPSGSLNGSRIDCMNFYFKFTRDSAGSSAIVEDGSITILAKTFNVMK